MSIFSDNHDFENIPEKTAGEEIKENAEARANKPKDESGELEPSKKADNTGSSLFAQPPTDTNRTSTHRSATDRLFEGLQLGN